MAVFDTSDILTTGLTVEGKTVLSGNTSNDILVISGATGELLKVTDSYNETLLSVGTTGGTTNFSVVTGGTRIHNFLYDSSNTTGTTKQVLSTTSTGVTWTDNIRQIALVTNLANAGDTGTINQTHVGIGYNGTITGWYLTVYPSASVTVDVWKVSGGVPTISNTITASAKPSTTSARFNSSTTLTGWSTTVNSGDYFMMNVDSNTAATYINLQLIIKI